MIKTNHRLFHFALFSSLLKPFPCAVLSTKNYKVLEDNHIANDTGRKKLKKSPLLICSYIYQPWVVTVSN